MRTRWLVTGPVVLALGVGVLAVRFSTPPRSAGHAVETTSTITSPTHATTTTTHQPVVPRPGTTTTTLAHVSVPTSTTNTVRHVVTPTTVPRAVSTTTLPRVVTTTTVANHGPTLVQFPPRGGSVSVVSDGIAYCHLPTFAIWVIYSNNTKWISPPLTLRGLYSVLQQDGVGHTLPSPIFVYAADGSNSAGYFVGCSMTPGGG